MVAGADLDRKELSASLHVGHGEHRDPDKDERPRRETENQPPDEGAPKPTTASHYVIQRGLSDELSNPLDVAEERLRCLHVRRERGVKE